MFFFTEKEYSGKIFLLLVRPDYHNDYMASWNTSRIKSLLGHFNNSRNIILFGFIIADGRLFVNVRAKIIALTQKMLYNTPARWKT